MDLRFEDRLRHLAIHGVVGDSPDAGQDIESNPLEARTLVLARLAALIAVGGAAVTSYSEITDAAVTADASADDCVEVLVSISDLVGLPRVVEAAPKLALALGYDLESALEEPVIG